MVPGFSNVGKNFFGGENYGFGDEVGYRNKIDSPLILKSKIESGCKASGFLDAHIIVGANGIGGVEIFDFERSETLGNFEPSKGKIILGIHVSEEIQDSGKENQYKLALILYKDGQIDVFIVMKNGVIETKEWTQIYSVKSPLSFMMQVPKLELIFSQFLIESINEEEKLPTEKDQTDPISSAFTQISGIDKLNKKGAINVVEFSIQNYIFIGYENGTIIPGYYSSSAGKVLPLTKGYTIDPVDDSPSIILSILPIFHKDSNNINLVVSCYTMEVSILEIKNIQADLEEKGQMKRIKGSKELCEIEITSVIKDAMFKPGTGEIKYHSQIIFVGSFDHRVRLFRVKKLHKPKLVGLLKHHKESINSVDLYSKDDQGEVLAGSEDGSISLWTLNF